MKKKTVKIICTLAVCVLVAGTVSARPHHHGGGGKDLHRAAAIVDIVTNSLIGLSILSGNAPVVTTPVVTPVPVYVAPPPPPRPVYVAPPRRYHRPAPPPPRHRAPAHRGGGHRGGRR